jgi:hypothetical protein
MSALPRYHLLALHNIWALPNDLNQIGGVGQVIDTPNAREADNGNGLALQRPIVW